MKKPLKRRPGHLCLMLGVLTATAMATPVFTAPVAAQQPAVHQPHSLITWNGQNKASAGSAMANNVCDYNGDGLGDIIASDWMWRRTGVDKIGTAYINADTMSHTLFPPTSSPICSPESLGMFR